MNQFEYTAQCEGGAAISGTFAASDGAEALKQLSSMGLRNVDLRQEARPRSPRRLSSEDFIFFNEQLASLASAGICLEAGLRQLGKDIQSPRLRGVFDAVAADIERGQSLETALEQHAAGMPALYARVVRAGVKSGQLPSTLLNLSHHLRLVAETRRLIAEALTYPAVVLVLALGILCTIIIVVVPQFAESFVDFGITLPWLTVMMISLAEALPGFLIGSGITAVGLVIVFLMLRARPAGRLAWERIVLTTPLIGPMIRNSLRARFLRAMAFAVNSGIPLPEAVRLSAEATASPVLSDEADRVARHVEGGGTVYDACHETGLIPAMFGYVVTVSGESLQDALTQLAKAYESRAVHAQSLLRGWLAPAGVLGVGFVIGLIILALFLPMVTLMQSI